MATLSIDGSKERKPGKPPPQKEKQERGIYMLFLALRVWIRSQPKKDSVV
jgi:hypothetical protein